MKLTFKTEHGFLSAQPPTPGGLVRWQYRDDAGPWETFEVDGFEFPPLPVPVPPTPTPTPPSGYDPNVQQPWPRPMPPDINTTDEIEVTNRVDWNLQSLNSSDDRSYWVDVIQGRKEHLAQPGWTADGYWRTEKMAKAEGNGHGYVWPPK